MNRRLFKEFFFSSMLKKNFCQKMILRYSSTELQKAGYLNKNVENSSMNLVSKKQEFITSNVTKEIMLITDTLLATIVIFFL